jgi:hypothetical protein
VQNLETLRRQLKTNSERKNIMAVESARQDVQVSVGKDFVIIGGDRVEVSPDGKTVTAYTNEGVETKAASGAATPREGAISQEAVPPSRPAHEGALFKGVVPPSRDGGISISTDFNTVVLNGATIERAADGHFVISSSGTVITKPGPANDSAARVAHEVGDHLKDGTVCIAVDLKNDNALFAPEGIFGGNARFDDQDKVVEKVNAGNGTHGHKDWRRISDAEGKKLSDAWNKVAPPALQGRAAPWFWLASPYGNDCDGRVRRGGETVSASHYRYDSLPVPVVRSGPVRR